MPSKPKVFRLPHLPTRQEQHRAFDQRRGSARKRGYNASWDRAALAFKNSHPLCLGCEAMGRIVVCEVVDHVMPHKGDMAVFWDPRWQSSCRWHHDVVKQKLEALYASGRITADDLWLNSKVAIEIASGLQ